MSDFKVKIEYKNKDLETIVEKEYDFIDYTEMLSLELKRVLMDIEDAFYYAITALLVKIRFVLCCYRPAFRCRNG